MFARRGLRACLLSLGWPARRWAKKNRAMSRNWNPPRTTMSGRRRLGLHVVLEALQPVARWPFDETKISESSYSLYEYSGVENKEPTLVGVKGGRGNRELIASCGTTLGSGLSGSMYNALSSDGEAIFFTVNPCSPGPATAEVYARLHGGVHGVGTAETVDVSASECTTACGGEWASNSRALPRWQAGAFDEHAEADR